MSLDSNAKPRTLVFSDLDGTLLDHYTYSFEAATACMEKLKSKNIPVIINTSKTKQEVISLRRLMGNTDPFVVENGAAIFMPKHTFPNQVEGSVEDGEYWVIALAKPRGYWIDLLEKLKPEFGDDFIGFNDMSIDMICECTGLNKNAAAEASKRLYGEPILWKGSSAKKAQFIAKASKLGAYPLLGGRFLHMCGNTNKGKALTRLTREYQQQFALSSIRTIALGDGNNDVHMLDQADIAIRILSPVNQAPKLSKKDNVYTSTKYGPEGWTEMLSTILHQ